MRITFVPFAPDGHAVAIAGPDGSVALPSGEIRPDEDLLDALLRIPLETAGWRYQGVHPLELDGEELLVWVEGDRYAGRRPHAVVPLCIEPVGVLAGRLDPAGSRAVLIAARDRDAMDHDTYAAHNRWLLERAYLRATTPEGGSGFGGSPSDWEAARSHIADGIDRDGTLLDVGCANGLLLESLRRWSAFVVEPHGVDISPALIDLARRRLPQWADRFWVGDALTWTHPDGMRFDLVHVLLDCVRDADHGRLAEHLLANVVAPGGRLLVSNYFDTAVGSQRTAAEILRGLGHAVAGESRGGLRTAPTAWIGSPPSRASPHDGLPPSGSTTARALRRDAL